MPIHHIKDGKLEKFEKISTDKEKKIEDFIETHPSILGDDIFVIGRQVSTPVGIPDIVGLDKNGNLVIVELKKGLPARKIVAQILDYAVWGEGLQYDDLNKIAKENHLVGGQDLYKKFEKIYGNIPEPFNQYQRLYLISEEFDPKTVGICRYLKRNEIDISCITINFHKSGEHELVDTDLVVGSEETKSEEFGGDKRSQDITWKERLEQKATKENKANITKFISNLESELGVKGEEHGGWFYICTKLPYQAKNLVAVLTLTIDTWQVSFRIDPSTFEYDDQVREVKGYWWKNRERRIKRSNENEDLIFKCIKHAIQATSKK